MRNDKQIKADMDRVDAAIYNITEAKELHEMPGGDKFEAFLDKAYNGYSRQIETLDPLSPHLSLDYGKIQFARNEIAKLLNSIAKSLEILNTLKETRLNLNREMETYKDELARRDRNRM